METKYSILMPVYFKENPDWFRKSIQSMLDQTVKCSEFVIIKDGPLTPELDSVIDEFTSKNEGLFKIVPLEKNVGLGPALNRGILECSNELIARMDSDDYSDPTRIEKELKVMEEHPEVSMVGTNVSEFIGETSNVVANCIMPETHDEIVSFSKSRNPFRHPSMLYKKSAVLKAGNYREYHLCEDYDIVVRLLQTGCICYNVQEILVYMRTSEDFYKRRGGLKYLKSIKKFKKEMLTSGWITRMQYFKTLAPHVVVCLMPNFLRGFVYKHFLRKKPVDPSQSPKRTKEEIEKINKTIKNVSFISLISLSLIGIVTGLSLTLVKKDEKRTIGVDEFRHNFNFEKCLENTKVLNYKIKIYDEELISKFGFKTQEIDASKNGEISPYYNFKNDDFDATNITENDKVDKAFLKFLQNTYYHMSVDTINKGVVNSIYKDSMLLVDKRKNDNYLVYSEDGLLLEGYIKDKFEVNKGVYYQTK